MRMSGLAVIVMAILLGACGDGSDTQDDLGSFLPEGEGAQSDATEDISLEGQDWSHLCKPSDLPSNYHYLYLGVQLVLATVEHAVVGVPMVDVTVEFFDMCDEKFAEAVTQEDGTAGFQLKVGGEGFDGYMQYTTETLPEFRTFDKPFSGFVMVNKLRMFDKTLFDSSLAIVGQKEHLAYVQGTVYNLVNENSLPGVVIRATSNGEPNGQIGYLGQELPLPMFNLTETQDQGVFFVVNAKPGQMIIEATLPDGRVFTRPVITKAMNSHPRKTITEVGIPVYPDAENGVPPAWGD